jgi:membrane associated rhomboid family serine protease
MLQDRPYMREGHMRNRTGILTWLISLVVAVYVVQSACARLPGLGVGVDRQLGLTPEGLRSGQVWTLLTYGFLHSTGNLLQIVAFLSIIYLTGREILPLTGTRRFVGLYLASLAAGGLFWSAVHWNQTDMLVGSSATAWSLIVLYACFFPNREVNIVLLFVLPVTLKPKLVAYALLAVDLCGLIFYEIMRIPFPFYAAHSAHLGGMAAGWIYYRYIHDSNWSVPTRSADAQSAHWMREVEDAETPDKPRTPDRGNRGRLRAEVDRILDKINSDGLSSLSEGERKLLDEARDLIGRQ